MSSDNVWRTLRLRLMEASRVLGRATSLGEQWLLWGAWRIARRSTQDSRDRSTSCKATETNVVDDFCYRLGREPRWVECVTDLGFYFYETKKIEGYETMKVLVLTGAGISAESGIPTFRGSDGLWEGHEISEVATPDGFRRNPELVHTFYNQRRSALLGESIQPNPAHVALADFEKNHDDEFLLVTQNIDDLHQRAGSQNVLPMHGELLKVRCMDTGELFDWREDLSLETPHPGAGSVGRLRPHVVWFGEMPIGMDQIAEAAQSADLFVAIGTSSQVYPAAGIVQSTKPDCRRVEINLDNTPQSSVFHEAIRGKASTEVPKFFQSLRG